MQLRQRQCAYCVFPAEANMFFAVSSIDIENDLNGDGAVDINDIVAF